MLKLFVIPVMCILLTGCGSSQPINKKYSVELSQLKPGTTLEEFRQTVPDAVVEGQNTIEGRRVDAYELSHRYTYDQWYGFTRDEYLWFYFYEERLVKWGPPNAWPAAADLIVGQRLR